jgi:hypothetical protein
LLKSRTVPATVRFTCFIYNATVVFNGKAMK